MFRLLLAGVLGSALGLGSAGAVAALDFEDPMVPPQFLLGAPPTAMPITSGGARLLTQGAGAGRRPSPPRPSRCRSPRGRERGRVPDPRGRPGPAPPF